MNVNDLRSELARRAEETGHGTATERMRGIRARHQRYRRRQAAGVAGLAAVMVLGAVALVPGADQVVDRGGQPAPATQAPTPDPEPVLAWPTEYAGDQLVASKIGEPGDAHLTLRFTPTTTDLQWNSLCTAPPKVYARVSINGHPLGGSGCVASEQPEGPGASFGGGGKARNQQGWESVGVRAGEVSVAEIRLADGRSLPADARLGLAFWDRSGPRLTSDGVTIQELSEGEAGTYRLVDYRTQPLTATARELSLEVPADVDDPFIRYGIEGPYSQIRWSRVTVSVSGSGRDDDAGLWGGGIGGGDFEDIAGETVTVSEGRDRVREGTLVIAIYAPID